MYILTPEEAEELIEHFSARPDLWIDVRGVWVRRQTEGQYALALRVQNGLPNGMHTLTVKALEWAPESAEEYIAWLLDKYTAYTLRSQIRTMLDRVVRKGTDTHALSRELCELHGGPFTRKRGR